MHSPEEIENLLERIFEEVLAEGERAQQLHGTPSPNPMRAMAILLEEAGEAAEAALKLTSYDAREREDQQDEHWRGRMRKELIEVASVAVRQIVNIDLGRTQEWVNIDRGLHEGKA